jgi:ATP-dependent protease ClpP protease subunit
MPYSNEHSARVRDPKDFDQDSFRRKNIDTGVDIIIGKLHGEDKTETQAYRFDVQKFTDSEAKKWCKDHDVNYILFEKAENASIVEGHIFVYGEIIPWQDKEPGNYGGINLKDVVNQINNNKEANRLIIHVHSPGGDLWEGFAIHDALANSGKEIVTIIEGLCASIATVIALSGSRRMMTEHSEFMIHNPWAFSIGDSEDFKKLSETLSKDENKLAEFYAKHTNLSTDELLSYMHEETFFTAKEAQDFGFVTEIINTIKQVAKMSTPKKLDKEQTEKLNGIQSLLQKVFNLLNPVKNLVIQDVNGTEIDFGDQVETEDQITVGMTATVDGSPANGDYTKQSGEVYKFESGKLTEIIPKTSESEEMQQLKEENERLKSELAEAQAKNQNYENSLQAVKTDFDKLTKEFNSFKNQFSEGNPPLNHPPKTNDKKVLMTKEEFEKCLN